MLSKKLSRTAPEKKRATCFSIPGRTSSPKLAPWVVLQPDLQYVFNPGAGVLNPSNPSEKLKDEVIIGLRANITL